MYHVDRRFLVESIDLPDFCNSFFFKIKSICAAAEKCDIVGWSTCGICKFLIDNSIKKHYQHTWKMHGAVYIQYYS